MTVNESNTQSDLPADITVVHSGPGQRLRLAREAAGLTLEAVAMHLRLRQELIQALEEDDASRLPSRAFVSGYVRSYARLLGLPGEDLAAMLNQGPPKAALVMPVMPPAERRSSDLPVKALTYFIVLVLAVLLTVWWFNSQPQPQPQPQPLSPPQVESIPQSPTEAQPQAPAAAGTEPPSVVAPGTTVDLPLPPAAPMVAPEPDITSGQNIPAAAPAAPLAVSAQRVTDILLEATSGDCWVDVIDADGKQLMFDMLKQGTTRTLRGKAPFGVFLGYAPAVTVYYQGKMFDHSTYQRRDVARFRLGKAADNKTAAE